MHFITSSLAAEQPLLGSELLGFAFEIIRKINVPAILTAFMVVSEAWLAARKGSEKGFSLEACTLDYLARFAHAVLRYGQSGQIVAFATLLHGAIQTEV